MKLNLSMTSHNSWAVGCVAAVAIPLASFGTDFHDVTGIIFAGGPEAGKFSLWIDQVRFN
jgi:hypothetical protein